MLLDCWIIPLRSDLSHLPNQPDKPFLFVSSICTVLLETPNCFAAARTVALCSMMYCANATARSSIFPFIRDTPPISVASFYEAGHAAMRRVECPIFYLFHKMHLLLLFVIYEGVNADAYLKPLSSISYLLSIETYKRDTGVCLGASLFLYSPSLRDVPPIFVFLSVFACNRRAAVLSYPR